MDLARERNVMLAGATGLVGSRCLDRLLESGSTDNVIALVRRPLPRTHHRLLVEVVDFAKLDERPPPPAWAALCALGTTIKQAGSQAAFRAVDHDAVVTFARWTWRAGASAFVMVSSVGADPRSRNFYLRVKGEAEQAVAEIGFPRLIFLRPSLLLGARTETRPGEAIARVVMPALSPLLVGSLRRYRGISADVVAAAMIAAARDEERGQRIWEHDQIVAAARTATG